MSNGKLKKCNHTKSLIIASLAVIVRCCVSSLCGITNKFEVDTFRLILSFEDYAFCEQYKIEEEILPTIWIFHRSIFGFLLPQEVVGFLLVDS